MTIYHSDSIVRRSDEILKDYLPTWIVIYFLMGTFLIFFFISYDYSIEPLSFPISCLATSFFSAVFYLVKFGKPKNIKIYWFGYKKKDHEERVGKSIYYLYLFAICGGMFLSAIIVISFADYLEFQSKMIFLTATSVICAGLTTVLSLHFFDKIWSRFGKIPEIKE